MKYESSFRLSRLKGLYFISADISNHFLQQLNAMYCIQVKLSELCCNVNAVDGAKTEVWALQLAKNTNTVDYEQN